MFNTIKYWILIFSGIEIETETETETETAAEVGTEWNGIIEVNGKCQTYVIGNEIQGGICAVLECPWWVEWYSMAGQV